MSGLNGHGLDSSAPGAGHNSARQPGPLVKLDADLLAHELQGRLEPHVARRDELLAGTTRFHSSYPKIDSDDVQNRATDFVRQLKACAKAIEDTRRFEKMPILDAQRALDRLFSEFAADLIAATASVEAKMTAYATEKVRVAREARAAAEAKLRAEAAAAERAALDGRASFDAAIEASKDADDARLAAAAPAADLSRVHSDFGGVSSLRGIVRHRVVDLDAVPRKYLMADDDALKLAGRGWKHGDPQRVAGVEFYIEQKVIVR